MGDGAYICKTHDNLHKCPKRYPYDSFAQYVVEIDIGWEAFQFRVESLSCRVMQEQVRFPVSARRGSLLMKSMK